MHFILHKRKKEIFYCSIDDRNRHNKAINESLNLRKKKGREGSIDLHERGI